MRVRTCQKRKCGDRTVGDRWAAAVWASPFGDPILAPGRWIDRERLATMSRTRLGVGQDGRPDSHQDTHAGLQIGGRDRSSWPAHLNRGDREQIRRALLKIGEKSGRGSFILEVADTWVAARQKWTGNLCGTVVIDALSETMISKA